MIFSGLHMMARIIMEKNVDWADAGLGFMYMAMVETFLWLLVYSIIFRG